MPPKKPTNQGISTHFKTESIVIIMASIILNLVTFIAALLSPKILRFREADRCHEIKGTFGEVKGECVVIRK